VHIYKLSFGAISIGRWQRITHGEIFLVVLWPVTVSDGMWQHMNLPNFCAWGLLVSFSLSAAGSGLK